MLGEPTREGESPLNARVITCTRRIVVDDAALKPLVAANAYRTYIEIRNDSMTNDDSIGLWFGLGDAPPHAYAFDPLPWDCFSLQNGQVWSDKTVAGHECYKGAIWYANSSAEQFITVLEMG